VLETEEERGSQCPYPPQREEGRANTGLGKKERNIYASNNPKKKGRKNYLELKRKLSAEGEPKIYKSILGVVAFCHSERKI